MVIQDKLYLSFLYMSTKHAKITVSSSTPVKPVFSTFSRRPIDAILRLCYNMGRKGSYLSLVVWKEMITYG